MWWRLPAAEWRRQRGEGNRQAFRRVVEAGPPPGLLACVSGRAVGWCAVAPREAFPRFQTSRILKAVDGRPVWSIVCFFVAREQRRRGVAERLLAAAVDYVRDRGGRIVEGYPVEPKKAQADAFAYTGVASMFRRAGFVEVARRSPTRPIMRLELGRS